MYRHHHHQQHLNIIRIRKINFGILKRTKNISKKKTFNRYVLFISSICLPTSTSSATAATKSCDESFFSGLFFRSLIEVQFFSFNHFWFQNIQPCKKKKKYKYKSQYTKICLTNRSSSLVKRSMDFFSIFIFFLFFCCCFAYCIFCVCNSYEFIEQDANDLTLATFKDLWSCLM